MRYYGEYGEDVIHFDLIIKKLYRGVKGFIKFLFKEYYD